VVLQSTSKKFLDTGPKIHAGIFFMLYHCQKNPNMVDSCNLV